MFCFAGNSLVVANSFQILQIGFNGGAGVPIVPFNFESYIVGLDIDYWYIDMMA